MRQNKNKRGKAGDKNGDNNQSGVGPSSSSTSERRKLVDDRLQLENEHPLLNHLVVSNIFKFGNPDVKDLKSLRLVCRLWHELTLQKWRETAILTLVLDPPIFQTQTDTGIWISKFLSEFQTPESLLKLSETPFTRYKLKRVTFDLKACNEDGTDSKLFWELIGPLTKYIHLEKCSFVNSVEKPIIQLLVRKLPNLEHLTLTASRRVGYTSRKETYRQMLMEKHYKTCHEKLRTLTIGGVPHQAFLLSNLFLMTPNLETIQGIEGRRVDTMKMNGLVKDILFAHARIDDKCGLRLFPSLKHLDLINLGTFYDGSKVLDLAQELTNTSLETFTIKLRSDARSGPVPADGFLGEIFRSQAETLNVVKIFRPPFQPAFQQFIHNIQMPVLTELHLWGTITQNFCFLNSAPNLKVLYINMFCFERQKEMRKLLEEERLRQNVRYNLVKSDWVRNVNTALMRNVSLQQMRSFQIDFEFPEKSLRELGRWMPNLKVLKTILNKATVSVVCEQWRNLTELVCLHESEVCDHNIVRSGTSNTIGNLKYLEKFQLVSLCGGTALTDKSVKKGFMQMSPLKSLQICVSKKMTQKAEDLLKSRFKDCRIIRNYGDCVHLDYDCCQRDKFTKDAANGLPAPRVTLSDFEDIDSSDYD